MYEITIYMSGISSPALPKKVHQAPLLATEALALESEERTDHNHPVTGKLNHMVN